MSVVRTHTYNLHTTTCERKYPAVSSFDARIPGVNAYQIHEWLHDTAMI